jgi:hypothetical protein
MTGQLLNWWRKLCAVCVICQADMTQPGRRDRRWPIDGACAQCNKRATHEANYQPQRRGK